MSQTEMQARLAALERELERSREDRARAAMDARNPLLARITELDAQNKDLLARLAALEAQAKQARDDEVWAEDNGVVIDAEPVEKGWCAMLVREDGPLIEVPSAKGPTIHAAIHAIREKVEGGAR